MRTPPIASWIAPKVRKPTASAIAGRGLFATEDIASSTVAAIKGGRIVMTDELHATLQNSDIQIADNLHLVALTETEYEPVMLIINHCRVPNVRFVGNVVLVAMRDARRRGGGGAHD